METVLGLSLTSTTIGWVLLDGPDPEANVVDHDAFDLGIGSASDGDISKHTAAIRGVQSIVAASGHPVTSIGVTWTGDADAKAMLLLKALPDMGFDNVVRVRLTDATRAWAGAFRRTLGFEKCAVCVVESAAVTALSFGYDSVRTFSTPMRESADGLCRWLTETFEKNRLEPEALYLIGARGDIGLLSGSLSEGLPTPVDASDETQLALATGAALAVATKAVTTEDAETRQAATAAKSTRLRRLLRQSAPAAPVAEPHHVEAWTAALKTPAGQAETTAASTTLAKAADVDAPRGRRWHYSVHARAATAVVAGVVALFFVVPMLTGPKDATPSENQAVSDAATTSVSVHAVPSIRIPAPTPAAVRQEAPAPPPPLDAPPVPPPAEALPVAVAQAPINEVIVAAPLVAPQPPLAALEPVAAVPPAPESAQPLVAPAAPEALPAEALPAAPIAAPPPGEPLPPPPPQDPLTQVLSPLFGALP